MNAPLLLLYNLDSPKGAKIRRMCLPLGIRTRMVPPEAYALPLGELAEGKEPPAGGAGEGFSDELLLMANFTSAQVDALLLGFRRNRIPPVRLKAVLTPTNRAWDSLALRRELLRERQAIAEGGPAAHGAP